MTTRIGQASIDGLRKDFTGAVIVPDDPGYDEAGPSSTR